MQDTALCIAIIIQVSQIDIVVICSHVYFSYSISKNKKLCLMQVLVVEKYISFDFYKYC